MNDFLHNEEQLILKYLDGEMSAEEKDQFEERLQNDAALQEKINGFKIGILAVKQTGTQDKVQSLHAEMMQEFEQQRHQARPAPVRKMVRMSLAVAASIFFIFIAYQAFNFLQLSPDKVYDETFVAYNVSSARGATEKSSPIKEYYKSENYRAVTSAESSAVLNSEDSLLVGLSHLQLNEPGAAIKWLQSINQPDSKYKQDAEFYLAMAYLKNKNYNEALELFQKISNDSNHLYHGQVPASLIRKVKMLKWK